MIGGFRKGVLTHKKPRMCLNEVYTSSTVVPHADVSKRETARRSHELEEADMTLRERVGENEP